MTSLTKHPRSRPELMLLPVSLVPFTLYPLNWAMAPPVVALSVMQGALAASFCQRRNERSARQLLAASLIYLPALFVLLILARVYGIS